MSDGLGKVSDGFGNVCVYVYEETWHQVQHETREKLWKYLQMGPMQQPVQE